MVEKLVLEQKILRILFLCAFWGNSSSSFLTSSAQQVPMSEAFHDCPEQPGKVELQGFIG